MPPDLMWFVAAAPWLSEKLDLVGALSLAGSTTAVNMQAAIMVALRSTALRSWSLLFYEVNTGLSQKAMCYFVANRYFSQRHRVKLG